MRDRLHTPHPGTHHDRRAGTRELNERAPLFGSSDRVSAGPGPSLPSRRQANTSSAIWAGDDVSPRDLLLEPRAREFPVSSDRLRRDVEDVCRLLDVQPSEEAQFHDAALSLVERRERLKGVIKRDD